MSNAYRSVLESGGTAPTGDAVAADVLTGKTFSNANAVGIAGAMVNNGAVSQTIPAGGSYTIPEGYHNGSGTVTAGLGGVNFIAENTAYEFAPNVLSANLGTIQATYSRNTATTLYFNVKGSNYNSVTTSGSNQAVYLISNGVVTGHSTGTQSLTGVDYVVFATIDTTTHTISFS